MKNQPQLSSQAHRFFVGALVTIRHANKYTGNYWDTRFTKVVRLTDKTIWCESVNEKNPPISYRVVCPTIAKARGAETIKCKDGSLKTYEGFFAIFQ